MLDTTAPQQQMTDHIRNGQGFIAALDQSGGSTPNALMQYGIARDTYTNDTEMFDEIHAMRTRIVNAPAFHGSKIIGAILFDQTMDRDMGGKPSAQALWEDHGVVPFLKIDKGLAPLASNVQLMSPIPDLSAQLVRARDKGIFGTKARSVIQAADVKGIHAIVSQQFALGAQVIDHGLMPILEPEITITIPDKAEAEAILADSLKRHLDTLPFGMQVMLKLSLPTHPDQYRTLVDHPACLKVVALSGGYSRDLANEKLAQNHGIIGSFSRALTEGLSAHQTDDAFNTTLAQTIDSIHAASIT